MTTRNRSARGNAHDAILSHPRQVQPHSEDYHNLVAFIEGQNTITVRARVGVLVMGWAPGDKLHDRSRPLVVNDGCVARLIVEQPPAFNQTAPTLALLVSTGQLDIVDDQSFDGATPHREVHDELRRKDLERQSKRFSGLGVQGSILGLLERVASLEHGPAAAAADLAGAHATIDAQEKALSSLKARLTKLEKASPPAS